MDAMVSYLLNQGAGGGNPHDANVVGLVHLVSCPQFPVVPGWAETEVGEEPIG